MMAASSSAAVNLQASAGDLARRLSCLRHFLLAANELLACEKAPSREINRHSRKIITLMEIAQGTLNAAGLKLYKFASCRQDLFPYKLSYFRLLRMLQRIRPCIDDRTLHGRINRLLLPLFTNMRTPASEELAEFSQASLNAPTPPGPSSPPRHTPSTLPPHAEASPIDPNQSAPSVDYRSMPPPDVLLCGRNRYRGRPVTQRPLAATAPPPRTTSPEREDTDEENFGEDTDSDSDEESPPPLYFRPRPKFGIYCTSKLSQFRQRNDHTPHPMDY
ncbi:hypothetical protein BXZ70DRAFT_565771 [Cristinia sonorae]|uniref:Uncharacterized protein n=1 Tax=Cristinia sonorae TaxID=1940300 RepID=A0A8K0UFC1_9AGAR|nr:hypothetical protein BXZ70DRAFT_565771 [Cristinia sonorae]